MSAVGRDEGKRWEGPERGSGCVLVLPAVENLRQKTNEVLTGWGSGGRRQRAQSMAQGHAGRCLDRGQIRFAISRHDGPQPRLPNPVPSPAIAFARTRLPLSEHLPSPPSGCRPHADPLVPPTPAYPSPCHCSSTIFSASRAPHAAPANLALWRDLSSGEPRASPLRAPPPVPLRPGRHTFGLFSFLLIGGWSRLHCGAGTTLVPRQSAISDVHDAHKRLCAPIASSITLLISRSNPARNHRPPLPSPTRTAPHGGFPSEPAVGPRGSSLFSSRC